MTIDEEAFYIITGEFVTQPNDLLRDIIEAYEQAKSMGSASQEGAGVEMSADAALQPLPANTALVQKLVGEIIWHRLKS